MNIEEWQNGDTFCKVIRSQEQEIENALRDVQVALRSITYENYRTSGIPNLQHLSFFSNTYSCSSETLVIKEYIEPLLGALRHPRSLCYSEPGTDRYLLSREYLLLSHSPQTALGTVSQKYLFDLGASLWNYGAGGVSQSWLLSQYAARGIQFDRIFMWEAIAHNPRDVFEHVPKSIMHAYQYFNIPAPPDPNDASNPLNILRKIAKTKDFVALKIDIDNFEVESRFIQQILADDMLAALIDELLYEHHVQFEPLVSCCWKETADNRTTLADSYSLFHELRTRGIRAHGWP